MDFIVCRASLPENSIRNTHANMSTHVSQSTCRGISDLLNINLCLSTIGGLSLFVGGAKRSLTICFALGGSGGQFLGFLGFNCLTLNRMWSATTSIDVY